MVSANILEKVIEAVDETLTELDLPVTPHNRLEILNGMHKKITTEGYTQSGDRDIARAIEDEIIRLSELDV